ncbi:hypothetical protein ACIQB5_42145 [Streptomyces sp. NPDC088560]
MVTMDLRENLRGIERQIDQVRQAPAPGDPCEEDDGAVGLIEVT